MMSILSEMASNRTLGNPIRLGIMIYLLPNGRALFRDLKEALEVSPGNLDSHLRALEKDGYVKIKKVIADRPRTAVYITKKGAEQTLEYLSTLKQILEIEENGDVK